MNVRSLACALALSAAPALAQSGPETLVLLVDPASAESLRFANEYAAAHDIPDVLRLHMAPGAVDFATQAAVNVEGFLGRLTQAGLEPQVDGVLAMPGSSYFVPASGYITDICSPVNRFAVTAAYTLAHQRADILGGLVVNVDNHYSRTNFVARAFDSATPYRFGQPSTAAAAERYYLGGLLGWTGSGGNTVQEVLDMIQRSAAVTGTHPSGSVYFMQTTDVARSGPRHDVYPTAVDRMLTSGGQAEHLFADLPLGRHDALGIMTGRATLPIDTADLTLLPGSFADHLTSFAGAFWTTSQTKMSRWIAKGASGTAGAVEEPCNYSGKFNHANLHVLYRRGLSLGEAWLRSLAFKPFQNLFLGDPLTRPWPQAPTVDVPDAPAGIVSGTVTLTPVAQATAAGHDIERVELYLGGVRVDVQPPGQAFQVDTTLLPNGPVDVRVVAFDTSLVEHAGRWDGVLIPVNGGPTLTGSWSVFNGDQATAVPVGYDVTGSADEVLLMSGGRVLAQASLAAGSSGTFVTYGANLGAGPVKAYVALRTDGRVVARTGRASIQISPDPGQPGDQPIAYDLSRRVRVDAAALLQLPAAFDVDPAQAVFQVLSPPSQGQLLTPADSPWQVLVPDPNASGSDTLVFQVTTPAGTSAPGTLTLLYDPAPCPPVERYCAAAPNSAGAGASLHLLGSTSLAADDLVLRVDGGVPGQFGFLFQGLGRTQVALGDGFLCIDSGHARYGVSSLDGNGTVQLPIDYAAPPLPAAQLTAGSTWSFQYWYRDPAAGGSGSNLTDALEATFCP